MRAAVLMVVATALAACSQGDTTNGRPAEAKQTAAPALSDAERATRLAALPAPWNTADLDNGRRNAARCRSCHTLNEGGSKMTGPNLYGVFGRTAGTSPEYNYSKAVKDAGFAWDAEGLDHWLENPRTFLPGNKMTYPGLPDAKDRQDLIAFLMVETGYRPETAAEAETPAPAPAA